MTSFLLAPNDPPTVTIVNAASQTPLLLLCDHAASAIPTRLADLGVDAHERERHICYDIGAAGLAHALSELFDAALILSGYSRLTIDCNRHPNDPTSIPSVSDGTPIPGNQNLCAAERKARIDEIFTPYHRAIANRLNDFQDLGIRPAILSIHSCTPSIDGFVRPWQVGVLWNRDKRIAEPLMTSLRRDGLCVGDNQPYSAQDAHGYTLPQHVEPLGLPHVLLEVRQDLIANAAGQRAWAQRLFDRLTPILQQFV